jgi:hypothetical protein
MFELSFVYGRHFTAIWQLPEFPHFKWDQIRLSVARRLGLKH